MSGLPPLAEITEITPISRVPIPRTTPGDLHRRPELAAARTYDLAIVGGGIYGAALALEASRRGLSTLLLERGDFGGATTWNSLRIVHGGLRYLQGLDLPRFRESMGERRWLLSAFPDLVEPLACLMPLYAPPRGGALRRPAAFRAALAANAWLGRRGNDGLAADRRLPGGSVLGAAETAERFPGVDREGLCGGALWYDAVAPDSQRLLIEMLRWAAACGARALNYVEAVGLRRERGRTVGVEARDRVSGARLLFAARRVANCAGPWSPLVARRLDRDVPGLFRPVLAWNVFLDREPLAPVALAAAPRRPGAPTYFVLPWKGRVLAGTAYAAPAADAANAANLADWDPGQGRPDPERVAGFLEDLNAALPALGAHTDQVLRVHWGWLPASAETPDAPASRPVVHDHGAHGGLQGLVSVSGVKLTTARAVAQEALRTLFAGQLPGVQAGAASRPPADPPLPLEELIRRAEEDPDAARRDVQALADRQGAVQLEDLLLRRTDWGIHPRRAAMAERLCATLRWGAAPEELPGGMTRRPAAVRGMG